LVPQEASNFEPFGDSHVSILRLHVAGSTRAVRS